MSQINLDLNYLAEDQPSMCIPRVFESISERQVREVFDQLDLGQLDHIDIIERRSDKGEKYKRIFIHFSRWYWNDDAITARRRLIEGKDIKVVYNMPWFWKISANRWNNNNNQYAMQRESNAIHEDIRRNVRRGGPRIEFEDDIRPHSEARNDRRPHSEARGDTRNDRRPSVDRRPHSEARGDTRNDTRPSVDRRPHSEARGDTRRNEVTPPAIKEEQIPKQSAAEIAQLEVINSTKRRKIILKKKEPQPNVELVVVESEAPAIAVVQALVKTEENA